MKKTKNTKSSKNHFNITIQDIRAVAKRLAEEKLTPEQIQEIQQKQKLKEAVEITGIDHCKFYHICYDKIRFMIRTLDGYGVRPSIPDTSNHPGLMITDDEYSEFRAFIEFYPKIWSEKRYRLLNRCHISKFEKMAETLCDKIWGTDRYRLNPSPTYWEVGVDVAMDFQILLSECKTLEISFQRSANNSPVINGNEIYWGNPKGKSSWFKIYKMEGGICRAELRVCSGAKNYRPKNIFNQKFAFYPFIDALSKFRPIGLPKCRTRDYYFSKIPDSEFKRKVLQGEGWLTPLSGFNERKNPKFKHDSIIISNSI